MIDDVTFIIPAYNEENNIGLLLGTINQTYPNSPVIVINNNSNDNTQNIAERYNATILSEKEQGKGNAIRTGFKVVKTKHAIMLDADNTYDPKEAVNLINPLVNDACHLVMGSRLNEKREEGAITRLNMLGNYILSFTASVLYSPVKDVCTGYWAFKKEVIDALLEEGINSNGFELEVEMFIKASKNNYKIQEVPITYKKRSDTPKLSSISDGWLIFKTLLAFKRAYINGRINDDTEISKIQSK